MTSAILVHCLASASNWSARQWQITIFCSTRSIIVKYHSPMTLPTDELGWASCASRETTLKDARGVEPGCVEIMPRKRVTFHVRTWLYSEQMETRFFSLSMTFTTGFRWTMNVWKSCGPWPTVSGCWTITRTVPELVPYAISIQLPLKPDEKNKTAQINLCQEKRLFLRIRISRDRLRMEAQRHQRFKVLESFTIKHCVYSSFWVLINSGTISAGNKGNNRHPSRL